MSEFFGFYSEHSIEFHFFICKTLPGCVGNGYGISLSITFRAFWEIDFSFQAFPFVSDAWEISIYAQNVCYQLRV